MLGIWLAMCAPGIGMPGWDQHPFRMQSHSSRPERTLIAARHSYAGQATLAQTLRDLESRTGLKLSTTLDANLPSTPQPTATPWEQLEALAKAHSARLVVTKQGKAISLEAGPAAPSATSGAFRMVVKQVTSRRDLESGKTITEITVEVHWLPTQPVFRIDTAPDATISGPGKLLNSGKVKTPTTACSHTVTFRLEGPSRDVKTLDLQGTFTVTGAEKMLAFRVKDITKPMTLTEAGVTISVKPPVKFDKRWEVPVTLQYPPTKVEFESYESGVWMSANRLQLIDPAGKPHEPMNELAQETLGQVLMTYRYPRMLRTEDFAGWSLVYETPTPPIEWAVPFSLKGIPLP
jgi:hypothetical protein